MATRGSDSRRARLQQRLTDTLLYSAQSDDAEVRLAREELMSEIPMLNRLLMRLQVATRLSECSIRRTCTSPSRDC